MLAVVLPILMMPVGFEEPGEVRPTVVVVAAPGYLAALEPWLASRHERGYSIRIVDPEQVLGDEDEATAADRLCAAIGRQLAGVASGGDDGGPYVLLVGDAPGPREKLDPSRLIPAARHGELAHAGAKPQFASDNEFGQPDSRGRPRAAVGRWPVRTPEEASVQVQKSLRYERDQRPGPHRRDVTFLATTPNYDPAVDPVLERMGMALINGQVKPHWGLRAMYASPRSEFFPGPREIQRQVMHWLEHPTPITLFAGHGFDQGVDFARYEQREYVVLDSNVARRINGQGPGTVLWISACSCGAFDLPPPHRGLAEALMMNQNGPTAVVAGSDVTSAWINLLLCLSLAQDVLERPPATLGAAFLRFKRAAFRAGPPLLKNMLLSMEPAERSEALPEDHQYLYNLLGDPTLTLRIPRKLQCKVAVSEEPSDHSGTRQFRVTGSLQGWDAGVVSASLVMDRMAMKQRLPDPATLQDAESRLQAYLSRFRMANDKTIAMEQAELRGGDFELRLSLPESEITRARWLQLYAYSATGENSPWLDGVAAEPVRLVTESPGEKEPIGN